jgi:hypothetical protein
VAGGITGPPCSWGYKYRDLALQVQIPYVYDYISKSCRQQAEVIQNHENGNVRYIGQGEARQKI